MATTKLLFTILLTACLVAPNFIPSKAESAAPESDTPAAQVTSLCEKNEHIVFSCVLKRTAKWVALCSSQDLDKEHGYLQYRFGLPGKIELEFPKGRQSTQQVFRYSHYFRFQVDLTEVNFANEGYQYSVFDNYNGEEKPSISEQGVKITPPGKGREVTYVCQGKAKADYTSLQDALPSEP